MKEIREVKARTKQENNEGNVKKEKEAKEGI
jgi:hypothetical protein